MMICCFKIVLNEAYDQTTPEVSFGENVEYTYDEHTGVYTIENIISDHADDQMIYLILKED